MRRRHADRSGFVVRILDPRTLRVVGTGFLVDDSRLVTCAHVVNLALGRDKREQEAPDASLRVPVDFPLLGDADGAPTRFCLVERWLPPPRSGTAGDDVAGLRIVGEQAPEGAGPARLPAGTGHAAENGGEVHVFGRPSVPARQDGSWAAARVRGRVGGGMLQVDAAADSAVRLQPGYSGSPMVTAGPGGDVVVGMLSVTGGPRGEHGDGYAVPVDRLIRAWPQVLAGIPPSPYCGLRSFTAADEAVFVGREEETGQLERMVADDTAVLVMGPSGIGKSSLVEAGLMPRWRAAGGVGVTARPGGSAPLRRILADVRVALGPAPGLDGDALRADVEADGLATAVSCWARRLGQRVLLHLDQFEELLTGTPEGDRAALVDDLFPAARAPSSALCVVATLRADFLPLLLELPGAGGRLRDRILALSPMGTEALERAVTEPARARGVRYEPGLAAQIAADTGGGPGSLPLMEFTLDRLWASQREHRVTFVDYRASGGVTGAVNRYAESVYERLRAEGHAEHVKTVLLALVRSRGGAAEAAAKAVPRARFTDGETAVDELVRQRLLVAEAGGDEPLVRLAHEALIRAWPRYTRWVDDDADFQRWLASMEERAGTDDLLADTRLGGAEHWLTERGDDVPDDVVRLVERSRSAWRRRVAELEDARAAAETAADDARAAAAEAQARQLAAASELATATDARGGALPLVLAVASVRARWTLAGDTALRHALRTTPRPLARLDCREQDPLKPVALSLSAAEPGLVMRAAYDYDRATATRRARYQLFHPVPGRGTFTETHAVECPALPTVSLELNGPFPYTRDGRALLRVEAGRATVVERATGAVLATDAAETADGRPLVAARLSADGGCLAVVRGRREDDRDSSDVTVHGATVRVTELATGSVRHALRVPSLRGAVAFSADCALLAVTAQWYDQDTHHKWMSETTVHDLRGGRAPVTVAHDGSATQRVVFSPDGTLLVAGANSVDSCGDSHTGHVEAFDLDDGGALRYRHYHYLPIQDLVFSPDGGVLAVAVGDSRHHQTPGAGQLVDARTGRERHRLHHDYAVESVVFNADGTRVAFAGARSARVFDVSHGDELQAVDHEQTLRDVVFDRDGRRLLTLAQDLHGDPGPARLFSSRGSELCRIDYPRFHEAALVSDDGSTAYLSREYGPWTVDRGAREYLDQVFDVLTHEELYTGRHRGDVRPLAIGPGGGRLVLAAGDRAEVHDVRGGTEPLHIRHEGCARVALARFTADGERLVTFAVRRGTSGGRLRITDLRRGTDLGTLELPGEVSAVSLDGRLVAAVVHDEDAHRSYSDRDHTGHGRLAVLCTEDGTRRTAFRARRNRDAVAFGPAGDWVAAVCEGTLSVRRTTDGARLWSTGIDSETDLLTVSPAGTHLAVAGRGSRFPFRQSLTLLDARDGRVLARYEPSAPCCAFSGDGRRFALCLDGGAQVIDLAGLEPLCVVEHERDSVADVRLLGASGSLLVTQDTHSIRVSHTSTADLLVEATDRLTRELTDSERRRHPLAGRCATATAVTGKIED